MAGARDNSSRLSKSVATTSWTAYIKERKGNTDTDGDHFAIAPESTAILRTLELTMINLSLVPRRPDLFNCTREKRGSLVTYHVHDVRWNQLPYMAQQQVGRLEAQNFSPKFELFDLNVTISYESVSQGGPFSTFAGCQKPRFAW